MKQRLLRAAIAALCMTMTGEAAVAGPISSACNQSSRSTATATLCSCIQAVADQTLRGADQKRAAGFFRNPDKAQEAFLSKKRVDDAFWERYSVFGQQAETVCSG